MRALSIVFSIAVVGIVFSFGMSVYTAIQQSKEQAQPAPISIPTPAAPR